MAYVFQSIAEKGKALGATSAADARTWYRNEASKLSSRSVNPNRFAQDKSNAQQSSIDIASIGQMFMFFYDPKTKDSLPYYDRFPLVFPVDLAPHGFYGINLHYLPPILRAKLMDELYATASNTKYDKTTKLKLSYRLLSAASRFRYFKPCFKYYLWAHVQSNFIKVDIKNWDIALMLPLERFSKASNQSVWKDSTNKVNGR